MNRLYTFTATLLTKTFKPAAYIIYEAYKTVDPGQHLVKSITTCGLKEYTTELIKQQWGSNLSKFEGMQMPGGVTLNGRQLYDDATAQIERLREKIRTGL